jgi:tape measure domain-containing protein
MAASMADLGFNINSDPLRRATRELNGLSQGAGRAERSNRQLSAASTALKAALTGVIASIGVREIIQYADIWQNVANQLRQVTSGTAELEAIQVRLGNVANDTRASFESTANLYARLARSSTELGLSQSDLIGLTTTINQSFAVSGATAAETAASITQLSQGLAAGALRGEEFNSVSEQAPALMRAISDSLGMTIGELRAFAAEGGITAEIVVKALQQASEEIDRNFSKTIATFSQNIEVANNKVLEWVGTNSAISESVGTAGAAIVLLSDNIDNLVNVAGAGLIVFAARFASGMTSATAAVIANQAATIRAAQATVTATASEAAYLRVVQGSLVAEMASTASTTRKIALRQQLAANTVALIAVQNSYTAALSASTVAARVSTVAMTAARGAMAFLGGPVGVALIAAGSLYYFRDALFATDVAASDAEKEVRKMAESIGEMTVAKTAAQMQDLNEQMAENAIATATARAELDRLREKQNESPATLKGIPSSATIDVSKVEEELAVLEATGKAMTEVYDTLQDRRDQLADAAEESNKRQAQSASDAVQKIIDSLDDELFQLEEGDRAWLVRRLSLQGATGDQIKYALSVYDAIDAEEAAIKQAESLADMREQADPGMAEFNRYADQLDQIEAYNISAAEKERLREFQFSDHTARMIDIAAEGVSKRFEVEETYWQQWMESAERNLTNFDDLSKTVIDNFTSSFGDAFESVILDSENTEEALKGLARTMIRSVVNAIGQMIAQYAALQALKMLGIGAETSAVVASEATKSAASVAGTTVAASASIAATTATTTAQVAAAGTTAAAWLPAALVASIGSFGAAAVVGGAALVAAYALIGGSFEGGGYTGSGPRSGGLDGKGGFMAMMHPQETVVDHTKGQSTGGGSGTVININNAPPGTRTEERTDNKGRQVVDVFLADISTGGPMSKAMQGTYGLKRQGR